MKEWLADDGISSSQQALDRFFDGRYVIDNKAFRSRFRLDPDLSAEPGDPGPPIGAWGTSTARRGHAESRQGRIALTTRDRRRRIGALVTLTAPRSPPSIRDGPRKPPAAPSTTRPCHRLRRAGCGGRGRRAAARPQDGKAIAGELFQARHHDRGVRLCSTATCAGRSRSKRRASTRRARRPARARRPVRERSRICRSSSMARLPMRCCASGRDRLLRRPRSAFLAHAIIARCSG